MFAAFEKKIISKYPLLWNTRFFTLIPIVLCIHFIYFLFGYLNVEFKDLGSHRSGMEGPGITFSILLSAIILIVWFVNYFRNNAFKSFYPVSNNRMFLEFLLLFKGIILTCSFIVSFAFGEHCRKLYFSADINVKEHAYTINLASHFIPFSLDDFRSDRNCDWKYTDSQWRYINSIRKQKNADSARISDLPGYEDAVTNESSEEISFSYLNYCNLFYTPGDEVDSNEAMQMHLQAYKWIVNKNEDAIRKSIEDLVELCKKYNVRYKIDPDKIIARIYQGKNYHVNHEVPTYYQESQIQEEFIEIHELRTIIGSAERSQRSFWKPEMLYGMFYPALAICFFFFAFRITRLRMWISSIVGAVITGIVFSLITASIASGRSSSSSVDSIILMALFLFVVFIVTASVSINSQQNKFIGGMTMIFSFWMLPIIIPIIFMLVGDLDCYPEEQCSTAARWVRHNWPLINLINFVFVFLIVRFTIIPLARNWQANPEE